MVTPVIILISQSGMSNVCLVRDLHLLSVGFVMLTSFLSCFVCICVIDTEYFVL